MIFVVRGWSSVLIALVLTLSANAVSAAPQLPKSLRLYVFDGGVIEVTDPSRFQLKKEEVGQLNLSVAAFLIAHPKGLLMWDTGAVPDSAWTPTGAPVRTTLKLPDGQTRQVIVTKRIQSQLESTGYKPQDIKYLVLSHYHYDHTANANLFAKATWLVTPIEHEQMFATPPPATVVPSGYSQLKSSKTQLIKGDYDVFGDGSVVIKPAPGHTPGHQVLYVKLPKTGGVVLSGDLYHYPEERKLHRVPTIELDQQKTVESRGVIEDFLQKSGSQLWIQHDLAAHQKLKKAPEFYE